MTKAVQGRVVAIQQQIFFANLLSDELDISTEIILRKLAMAGLSLTSDMNEIVLDASAIYPTLNEYRAPLRAVPDEVK